MDAPRPGSAVCSAVLAARAGRRSFRRRAGAGLAVGAAAAAAAGARRQVPPYEIRTLPNGLQVVVGRTTSSRPSALRLMCGPAARAIRRESRASPRWRRRCSIRARRRGRRSRLPTHDRFDRRRDRRRRGSDLTFVNVVVMKDSLASGSTWCPTSPATRRSHRRRIERSAADAVGLKVSYEDPEYLAGVVFDRLVYGFHPYGRPTPARRSRSPAITRDDLVAFHKRWFGAEQRDSRGRRRRHGRRGVRRRRARVRQLGAARRPPVPVADRRRRRAASSSSIGRAPCRPRFASATRRCRASTRLPRARPRHQDSRRRGRQPPAPRAAIGARPDLRRRRPTCNALKEAGDIVADTDTRSETTGEALRLIVDEFWPLQRERVSERELSDAQAYLTGSFPLTIETPTRSRCRC